MPKILLLITVLVVIILIAALILIVNTNSPSSVSKSETDTAINQAQYFYQQKRVIDGDFSNGPCLTNALMPDWAVDIVHNPRVAIDDLPQNQCSSFLEGRTSHLVELDMNGNLVRIR